jgi:hypothetical protein
MEPSEITLHFLPAMSEEDRRQDFALAKLERGIDKHRPPASAVFGRELAYGLGAPDFALPLFSEPAYNPEAMDKLLNWMFEQEDQIQAAVIAYLEDPSDRRLKAVLKIIDVAAETVYPKPMTLIQLILRILPAKKEELYRVARDQHNAKRPEAAIRQILRRLTLEGRIELKGELYHAV